MQKKLLSALVGAAFISTISISTYAAIPASVDFAAAAANASDPYVYIETLPGQVAQNPACGGLGLVVPVGFSIGAGTSKYIRIELTNATFSADATAAFTEGDITAVGPAGTALGSYVHALGAASGDNFVVVEVAASVAATDITATESIGFDFGSVPLDVTGEVGVSVTIHQDAIQAQNNTDALGGGTAGDFISFAGGGTALTSSPTNSEEIDPTDPTAFVDASTETDLTDLDITAGNACQAVGTAYVPATTVTLVVTGDFTAFPTIAADVYIDNDGGCNNKNVTATPITDTTATFTNLPVGSLVPAAELCVDNTTDLDMNQSNYSCTATLDDGTEQDLEFADLNCGALQFAGSSDRVAYGLTPGGAYRQYFRVSNPSSTDGDVAITLTNDDGESVNFPLGNVTNIKGVVEATNMPAGSSTDLLFVDTLFAAAQAAAIAEGGTFEHNDGKMRVVVRGNFGDDATVGAATTTTLGDANTTDGIILEAIAVGKNGEIVIME